MYRKIVIRVVHELVSFGYKANLVRAYQTAIAGSSGNGDDDDGDGSLGGLADLHLQTPAHRLGCDNATGIFGVRCDEASVVFSVHGVDEL